MNEVKKVQYVIFILVIIAAIMGCVLSYILSKKNYKPLENLIQMIKIGSKNNVEENSGNEYRMLETAVQSILMQEKQLKDRIEQYKPILINTYLNRLLNSNKSEHEKIVKMLNLLGITFVHPYYSCFIISSKTKYCVQEASLNSFISEISNIAQKNDVTLYFAEAASYLRSGICNYLDEVRFNDFLNALTQILKKNDNMLIIGFGRCYSSPERICISFEEAKIALEHRLIKGNENIITFEDSMNERWHYYYPSDKEQCIENCLKSGQYDDAVVVFREIMKKNLTHECQNINSYKYFFTNAKLTALKVLDEVGINDTVDMNCEIFSQCESIEEAAQHIEKIYYDVCNTIDKYRKLKREHNNESLIEDILEYIEQDYTEVSFSLTSIAEEFGMSISQISKFFKEKLGCNFLDYISKKRIDLAKDILEEKDIDIYSLVELVGYNNAVTFRRVFKKYSGVSPSKYRDDVCKLT